MQFLIINLNRPRGPKQQFKDKKQKKKLKNCLIQVYTINSVQNSIKWKDLKRKPSILDR